MTSIFNDFESPTSGTTITTGNSSNADGSSAFTGITGSPTTDTTHVAHGSQAMKINVTSATAYCEWNSVGPFNTSAGTIWGRAYIYLTANPTGSWKIFQVANASNGIYSQIVINTSGKVIQQNTAGTVVSTSTNSVALNQWVRIEFQLTVGTTTGVQEVKLFNSAESTSPTETNTLTSQNTGTGVVAIGRIGQCSGNTVTGWIDSVNFSDTAYPGPFGTPVTVTGSVANIPIGAPTGSVSTQANVAGLVANIALGAPTGAVKTNVTIAGAVANIAFGAPTGSVNLGSFVNVSGVTANIAIGAPTGSVGAVSNVNVLGLAANFLFQAPQGAVTLIPPWIFKPPHFKQRPADPQGERLWLYYGVDVGVSVLKNHDGTYTQQAYPTTDQINAAAFVYLGGHEYQVTNEEHDALVAAGYLSGFDDPLDDGFFGDGSYGGDAFGP